MKRQLCLFSMLLTFACSYAKKEYIQFTPAYENHSMHISGNLPPKFLEKLKKADGYVSRKELEEILGRKIETTFPDTYVAFVLNYFADYGYELQQAMVVSDNKYVYILVRDTDKQKED